VRNLVGGISLFDQGNASINCPSLHKQVYNLTGKTYIKFVILLLLTCKVLPLCEQVYQGENNSEGLLHNLLMTKFSHLVHFQRRPSNLPDEDVIGDDIEEEEVANV
jgi:hypothetical protein